MFDKDSPVNVMGFRVHDAVLKQTPHIKNTNDIMNHIYRMLREMLDEAGFQKTKLEPNLNVSVEYSFTMLSYTAIVTLTGRDILFKRFNR